MSGEEFRDQLDQVHRMGLSPVRPLYIDLSIAKPDQEFNLAGNFFYVKDSPGQNEYVNVKVNNSALPAIPWSKQTGFVQPFNRLYITTPAGQTGLMTILIASEATQLFDIIDHRSAISTVMQAVLDELQGDVIPETWGTEKTVGNGIAVEILAANASRKTAVIQSKAVNGGKVYIGYDNSVLPTKWIAELQAGQPFAVNDYRGALWARADAAGQLVGYGEH